MPHPVTAPARKPVSDISRSALSVLNSVFGLPGFRGAQEQIVRHVTEGGNCLVLMPTGGGKSLCYQLPSLLGAMPAALLGGVGTFAVALLWMKLFPSLRKVERLE